MDSNTFLLLFGLDPEQFERVGTAVETLDGGCWALSLTQRQDERECPLCHSSSACVVHDHYTQKVRAKMPDGRMGLIVIRKPKIYCGRCRRCFTIPLRGVAKGDSLSERTKLAIKEDLRKMRTFTQIAGDYGIAVSKAISLFDELYPSVPRLSLPEALCVDEILFSQRVEGKYPTFLYDYDTREVVDICPSRQKAWLEQYFSKIPEGERKKVKYFVSDMYDEYHRIAKKFFPGAMRIVDLFHVVEQLTDAVKRLRAGLMNSMSRDSFEYGFMKSRWKLFEARQEAIPDAYYTHRSDGVSMKCFDALMECLHKSPNLWDGWSILQELYHWHDYRTFTDALDFVERIASKLINTSSEDLKKVGRTYLKWKVEIANSLAGNQTGKRFSNAIAEERNKDAKTLKTISNGCLNFSRFRKRVLLILTYSKKKR